MTYNNDTQITLSVAEIEIQMSWSDHLHELEKRDEQVRVLEQAVCVYKNHECILRSSLVSDNISYVCCIKMDTLKM